MSASPQGLRILLTRSLDDNRVWAETLRERGLDPVTLNCIETEPLPEAAEDLQAELAEADWLTLSSRRAVRALVDLEARLPDSLQIACVGPATALEAKEVFGRVDRVAPDATGRSLGAELAATLPRSARVVVAAAQEGRVDIEDVLRPAGLDVRRVPVYRTRPAEPSEQPLRLADLKLDAVFLASPSAVTGLLNQATLPEGVRVVTLGPSTSTAARDAGIPVHAEARARGLDGMLTALEEHLESEKQS